MLCTCSGGVQCECARMRETIENRFAGSNLRSGTTVIFLVKEKSPFFDPLITSISYLMPFSSIITNPLSGAGGRRSQLIKPLC